MIAAFNTVYSKRMHKRGKSFNTVQYLRNKKLLVNKVLLELFKQNKSTFDISKLDSALTHTLHLRGKRIRPIIAIATYELFASDLKVIARPACAIELIHAGSLMLDDLPSMDNASYRRGKKTNHLLHGESTVILASAGLWVKAFDLLSDVKDDTINALVRDTSRFIGENGLILGQYLDLFSFDKITTVAQLEYCYELKTAALFRLAVRYGSVLGGADKKSIKTLDQFASHLGIAFQIRDDILDVTETLKESGKDPNQDQINKKINYVSLLGIARAKKELTRHINAAKAELNKLPLDCTTLEGITNQLILE